MRPTETSQPCGDLVPDLSDRDKVYVYVMRCSGTFELFLTRLKLALCLRSSASIAATCGHGHGYRAAAIRRRARFAPFHPTASRSASKIDSPVIRNYTVARGH